MLYIKTGAVGGALAAVTDNKVVSAGQRWSPLYIGFLLQIHVAGTV